MLIASIDYFQVQYAAVNEENFSFARCEEEAVESR